MGIKANILIATPKNTANSGHTSLMGSGKHNHKMSRRIREYVMDSRTLSNLLRSREKVVCYTCDGTIKVGDKVVSATNRHNGHQILRHRNCAKRINLI